MFAALLTFTLLAQDNGAGPSAPSTSPQPLSSQPLSPPPQGNAPSGTRRQFQVPTLATERTDVGPLTLDIPVGWRRTWRFGTVRFDAPTGNAYVLIDTSQTLTPNMDPTECRDKIVGNLGGRAAFRPLVLGGQPAAEQVFVETGITNSIVTARYVGCDGNTTWSVLFEGDYWRTQGAFQLMVNQVMNSLHYTPRQGPQ